MQAATLDGWLRGVLGELLPEVVCPDCRDAMTADKVMAQEWLYGPEQGYVEDCRWWHRHDDGTFHRGVRVVAQRGVPR